MLAPKNLALWVEISNFWGGILPYPPPPPLNIPENEYFQTTNQVRQVVANPIQFCYFIMYSSQMSNSFYASKLKELDKSVYVYVFAALYIAKGGDMWRLIPVPSN